MSEQHKSHAEHGESLKPIESSSEHLMTHHERELTKHEKEHGTKEHVEKLSKHVETKAISGKELSQGEREAGHGHHPALVNKHLKEMAFSRALTRARKKLSVPSRAFSKFAHIPAVDKASEAIGKTIARPAGMLWGSVLAFIGASALLWITKHYGYEYNYLMLIVLFGGGLILGNVAEFAWRAVKATR